ncbi:DUF3375 family protein [Mycobacteroides abscessus]|uniref:DUF3375 family protein n=1 Tax=Mycobacteroides abscessus TaxID=36809 RepID=UPI00078D6B6F|nr:DUF3375 family protein [Mycobacteroides abscessus]AMU23404.1 hypothetical protein A3N95_23130 [Mycobacteroides abscessus]SIA30935.1 putative alanine and proline rich protein [Mycobacteroides abscessus subsp. bolletii]SIA79051.1 putative alanine and proline rich protein [Mycobacteroides abscessus subsp. bolletii]
MADVWGRGQAELFAVNEQLQESSAVRLLAANNLAAYVTLMERHLDHVAKITESELVPRLEQDLDSVGLGDLTALVLIKRWSRDGFLNRVSVGTGPAAQNYCSLSEDARDVLAFLRGLRRAASVATGGSMDRISSGLKKVASQLDDDPERVREDIEAQIEDLYRLLDELDEGRRPEPNILNLTDEAQSIALQMEQIVNDVVRYGSRQNEITTGLISGTDESDREFRDRSARMFSDYNDLFNSRERASYMAFAHTVQDPDKRARLKVDIDLITDRLPNLHPGLRDVMRSFFKLVNAQIGEVARVEQRCAQRINRFFRSGTAEQARGLARQINEAIARAQSLLEESIVDSPTKVDFPIGALAATSIDQLAFNIQDPTPPQPAREAAPPADLSGFGALAAQVDMVALTELVNTAVAVGPVSLPAVVGMVETPFLGDVMVLWSMASKQDSAQKRATRPVRFRSIAGGECVMEVPELYFHELLPDAERQ